MKASSPFQKIIPKTDYIKVIYEYTNPVQDFIPSLSRKNFMASQYTYSPSQNTIIRTFKISSINETITIDSNETLLEQAVKPSKTPIVLGSESVYLNNKKLTREPIIF